MASKAAQSPKRRVVIKSEGAPRANDETEELKKPDPEVKKAEGDESAKAMQFVVTGTPIEDYEEDDWEDDEEDDDEPEEDLADKAMGDCEDDDKAQKSDADDDKKKDEDKKDEAEKSLHVTEATLQKSLDALKSYTLAHDGRSRRRALIRKSETQELTKSERRELYHLLGKKRAVKSMSARLAAEFEGEAMQKSLTEAENGDVGAFLEQFQDGICKSLGTLADANESHARRQHSVNLLVCKALAQVGSTVQAIGQRLQVIERQPVRERKSLGVQAVQKSFGQTAADGQLSREELAATLTEMNRASYAQGRGGLSKSNVSIVDAVSTLTTSGAVDGRILKDIHEFRKSQQGQL